MKFPNIELRVHLEGIFTPAEPAGRGVGWDEVFTGYCDGAQQVGEAFDWAGLAPRPSVGPGPPGGVR